MGQESVGNQPSHPVNQAVGLLVFLGGLVLLVLVFTWTYHLYQSLDTGVFRVSAAQNVPPVAGVNESAPLPPGSLQAQPRPEASALTVALTLGVRLLVLLGMGWLGALIASKGIALAVGPPRTQAPQ